MPLSSNEFAMNHPLAKSKQAACPLMSKFQLKVMIVTRRLSDLGLNTPFFFSQGRKNDYLTLKLPVYRVFLSFTHIFVSLLANLSCQHMEPLQIVGNTDQRPFPSHSLQPPQQELPESHHLLDDSKYRLHRGLALGVDRLAFCGL